MAIDRVYVPRESIRRLRIIRNLLLTRRPVAWVFHLTELRILVGDALRVIEQLVSQAGE